MQVPAASMIESAVDSLKDGILPDNIRHAQLLEFRAAVPTSNSDKEEGYVLGVQTARVMTWFRPGIELARQIAVLSDTMGSDDWLNKVAEMITEEIKNSI